MEKQNEFNQNAVKKADFGVTIPTKDAEEYYEYKRCKKRAEIIGGGAMLLYMILHEIGASQMRLSDEDNLEGYARGVATR